MTRKRYGAQRNHNINKGVSRYNRGRTPHKENATIDFEACNRGLVCWAVLPDFFKRIDLCRVVYG